MERALVRGIPDDGKRRASGKIETNIPHMTKGTQNGRSYNCKLHAIFAQTIQVINWPNALQNYCSVRTGAALNCGQPIRGKSIADQVGIRTLFAWKIGKNQIFSGQTRMGIKT